MCQVSAVTESALRLKAPVASRGDGGGTQATCSAARCRRKGLIASSTVHFYSESRGPTSLSSARPR